MKGSKNLFNLFRSAKYRHDHKTNAFPHFGLDLFIGRFGSGKTLSSVDVVTNICEKFPNVRICSNVNFHIFEENKNFFFVDNEKDFIPKLLDIFNNSLDDGCIVLLDEVHTFLVDTLDSPGSVNYKAFFAILSQLRKLHCLFIMTSQLYGKVPKVLRDYVIQNGNIVTCKQLIPGLTYYGFYDMTDLKEDSKCHLVGKIKNYDYAVHSPELYEAYDSFAVVSAIAGLFNKEVKNGDSGSCKSNNSSN